MKKVLIIDDDMRARTTMTIILKRAGFEIVTAENGAKGLACLRDEVPDLIITDIIMPEKEGIETIREILAERPGTKILAVSGGGRVGAGNTLHMAKALGATEVLAKPFGPDELIGCVARCLEAA